MHVKEEKEKEMEGRVCVNVYVRELVSNSGKWIPIHELMSATRENAWAYINLFHMWEDAPRKISVSIQFSSVHFLC